MKTTCRVYLEKYKNKKFKQGHTTWVVVEILGGQEVLNLPHIFKVGGQIPPVFTLDLPEVFARLAPSLGFSYYCMCSTCVSEDHPCFVRYNPRHGFNCTCCAPVSYSSCTKQHPLHQLHHNIIIFRSYDDFSLIFSLQ